MALRLLLIAVAVMVLCLPGQVRADTAVFSSRQGVAIGGYDAVAYFLEGAAEPGHRRHAVMWKGVVWQFASARNRAQFEANPRAYAPAFGGYCAYAMSKGRLKDGNPQLWTIDGGELFLLNNAGAREIWAASRADMVAQARLHWPVILKK